jgi:hypothetical protein
MHKFNVEMINYVNIIIIIKIINDRLFAETELGIQAENERVLTRQLRSR